MRTIESNRVRVTISMLLVFLAIISSVSASSLTGLSQISNLNEDYFFAEHKYVLAYIDNTSGKCKKCDKARKLLEEVVQKVPARFGLKIAFINKKTDSALLKNLKIFETPCFAYLANRRAVPYRDDIWNSAAISKWLKKRIIKPSYPFEYETDFEGHERSHPRVVTYAGKRNKYYNIFRYVASSYEDIHFLHSFSPPVLDRRNRTVFFTKNPEKTSFFINVPFTASQLNELIETHNNVQRILDAPTVARIMTKEDLTLLLVHTDPFHPAATNFFKTGLKFKDQALFVSTPLREEKFMKKIVRWLGIGASNNKPYPCLRLIARENGQMRKYEFSGEINEMTITKFLEDYKSGQLKKYYLSEEVPNEQNGLVTKVVGSNFDSVVNNKLKDVVVYFHSIWCLECKDILPVYESLAGRFSGYSDIQFISVDSYNNEGDRIPDGADGEPMMVLYRAENKKKPLKYRTKWMLGEMTNWLENHLDLKVDL